MNNPVLPKLLEAEADLSNREAVLTAQLSTVREQRKGLQTVIEMFNAGSLPAAEIETTSLRTADETIPEMAPEAITDPITFETAAPGPVTDSLSEAESPPSPKKSPKKTRSQRSAKQTKSTARKTGKKRSSTSNWQNYIRKTFSQQPLPEVVATVLRSQPDSVFEIAEVMDAIFTENISKSDFLKARNRISNILSAGARNGTWYRGRQGQYSLSDKALKAS